MKLLKKTGMNKMLAIVTVLMMAISVIGLVPTVAKAETGEPEGYTSTFTLKGEAQDKIEYYCIKLTLTGYTKNTSSDKTITIEKYKGGTWVSAGNKTVFGTSINNYYVTNDEGSGFNFTFGDYVRARVNCGSQPAEYSNYVKVNYPSGGGETPGGSETPSDPEEENLHCKYNGHDWSDPDPVTKARKCNYCGKVCNHEQYRGGKCTVCSMPCDHSGDTSQEKKNLDWESDYEQGHHCKYRKTCSVCNVTRDFTDPIEPHDFTGGTVTYAGDGKHRKTCSKCGYSALENCDYKVVKASYSEDSSFPDQAAKGHDATLVCKVCGNKETVSCEKHTLVGGKCTVCGWKKVKPGKLSGVKIKVKSKKTSKRTFRSHGYFDYLGRWVSGKTTHTTLKICKVNIKFKKAKNAYKYKIEKRPGSGTTMNDSWITTKTNNNYEMWFKGGTGKVTVKITPYSKEGIKGKTIKKTIRI